MWIVDPKWKFLCVLTDRIVAIHTHTYARVNTYSVFDILRIGTIESNAVVRREVENKPIS